MFFMALNRLKKVLVLLFLFPNIKATTWYFPTDFTLADTAYQQADDFTKAVAQKIPGENIQYLNIGKKLSFDQNTIAFNKIEYDDYTLTSNKNFIQSQKGSSLVNGLEGVNIYPESIQDLEKLALIAPRQNVAKYKINFAEPTYSFGTFFTLYKNPNPEATADTKLYYTINNTTNEQILDFTIEKKSISMNISGANTTVDLYTSFAGIISDQPFQTIEFYTTADDVTQGTIPTFKYKVEFIGGKFAYTMSLPEGFDNISQAQQKALLALFHNEPDRLVLFYNANANLSATENSAQNTLLNSALGANFIKKRDLPWMDLPGLSPLKIGLNPWLPIDCSKNISFSVQPFSRIHRGSCKKKSSSNGLFFRVNNNSSWNLLTFFAGYGWNKGSARDNQNQSQRHKARINAFYVGGNAALGPGIRNQGWILAGHFLWGRGQQKTQRFIPLEDTFYQGKNDCWGINSLFEGGWTFKRKNWRILPSVSLQGIYSRYSPYNESNAPLSLRYKAYNQTQFKWETSLRVEHNSNKYQFFVIPSIILLDYDRQIKQVLFMENMNDPYEILIPKKKTMGAHLTFGVAYSLAHKWTLQGQAQARVQKKSFSFSCGFELSRRFLA